MHSAGLYILRNINETPTPKLSGDATLRSVLTTMKLEAMQNLKMVLNSMPLELRRQALYYIVGVYDGTELDGIQAALRFDNATEMENNVGTIAETLLAKGEARGLVAGEAKGKAETLMRLMERRFGPVPLKHRQRIAAAKIDQIEDWFDAAIDAPDPDSIFVSNTRH